MPWLQKTHNARLKQAQPRATQHDPVERKIRNKARYRRFRTMFKRRWPICCDPFDSHPDTVEPTADMHHIYGLANRPDLAYVEEANAPLCTACHGKINAMERKNEPTEQLFKVFRTKVKG